MSLERHQQDWERLAEVDALWAVLTAPGRKGGRWDVDEFFATGEAEIAQSLDVADGSAGRRAASGRSTSAAASAGSRARSAPASSGDRRRHLGRDGRAGAAPERGVRRLRVPGQRRRRPRPARAATPSTSSTRASRCSTSRPCRDRAVHHRVPPRRASGRRSSSSGSRPHPVPLVAAAAPPCLRGCCGRLGVSEEWMLRRTPLTPMRMTHVPEADVRALLEPRRRVGAADGADRRGPDPRAALLRQPGVDGLVPAGRLRPGEARRLRRTGGGEALGASSTPETTAAMSSGSSGSKSAAASPPTSAIAGMFDAATGRRTPSPRAAAGRSPRRGSGRRGRPCGGRAPRAPRRGRGHARRRPAGPAVPRGRRR